MGGTCCNSDNSKEGEQVAYRTEHRRVRDYDSDDSSDPDGVNAGIVSDDEVPRSRVDSDAKPPDAASKDNLLPEKETALTTRVSTINAINRNVLQGWKDAVSSGNDSLVIHLYEEYKDHNVINVTFDNGDNSLHVACQTKKLNVAYFLLTKGISVKYILCTVNKYNK